MDSAYSNSNSRCSQYSSSPKRPLAAPITPPKRAQDATSTNVEQVCATFFRTRQKRSGHPPCLIRRRGHRHHHHHHHHHSHHRNRHNPLPPAPCPLSPVPCPLFPVPGEGGPAAEAEPLDNSMGVPMGDGAPQVYVFFVRRPW